jgi:proteasome-associated ATPase
MIIRGPASYDDITKTFNLAVVDDRQRLRDQVRMLENALARMDEDATVKAVVVGDSKGKLIVRDGVHTVGVRPPVGLDVCVGDSVFLNRKTGAIMERIEEPGRHGQVLKVKALDGDHGIELELQNGASGYARHNRKDLKVGDRVTMDETGCVVTHVLPSERQALVYAEETGVTWDDIGGQADAKRALIETIEEPYKHQDLYEKYGKKPAKGVLLHGPPGNGKTMLAKAVATSLASVHGAGARAGGFIYVKGPEVLNKFVGASEGAVRGIFASARQFEKENGYPAVICIDEADALVPRRGMHANEGMERTIVPQFLAEMDGLDATGAVVLLLTNRPDALDPAVVRDGRIDRKIRVARPTRDDAKEIVVGVLKGRLTTIPEDLTTRVVDEVWGGKYPVLMIRSKSKLGDRRLGLEKFVSGAMIVGIVERATQLAIRRDVASGKESGIGEADIIEAVRETWRELSRLDHTDVVLENISPNENVQIESIAT